MASTSYTISDMGNKLNSYSLWGIKSPMYVRLNIDYAGSSAFSFNVRVCHMATGDVLFTACMTFVYVDYSTRKPAPFPEWYNKQKKVQQLGPPHPRLVTPSIPADAFAYETQSAYSDIDHNGHVNQSIYVKWCTDAGTEAAINGNYTGFKQNIGKYPLDTFELKYVKEGMVGESFVVYTWQDLDSPLTLHFVVTRNGNTATVAKFKFKSFEIISRL